MGSPQIRRIVVATDFSEAARRAQARAAAHARPPRAALDPVHRRARFLPSGGWAWARTRRRRAALLDDIDRVLAAQAQTVVDEGVSCVTTSLDGGARTLVSHAARVDADLIVVGSGGGDALERSLLGDRAERVLQRARCPVLIVPGA
jgi:nucleotide-binding universal stress UspA family protein